jgi:hypothetical protein
MNMQAKPEVKVRRDTPLDRCFICDREAAALKQPLMWFGMNQMCPYCKRVWYTAVHDIGRSKWTHPRGVATTQLLYLQRKFILCAQLMGVSARGTAWLLDAADVLK